MKLKGRVDGGFKGMEEGIVGNGCGVDGDPWISSWMDKSIVIECAQPTC